MIMDPDVKTRLKVIRTVENKPKIDTSHAVAKGRLL